LRTKKKLAEDAERQAREAERVKEQEEAEAHKAKDKQENEGTEAKPDLPVPDEQAIHIPVDGEPVSLGDTTHPEKEEDENENPEETNDDNGQKSEEEEKPTLVPSQELLELRAERHKFSQEASQARTDWSDANNKLQDLEDELKNLETLSTLDLGPQNEYFAIWNKPVNQRIEQYNYEFIPFVSLNQDSTSIGNWNSWKEKHSKMSYTGGQACWQGPVRSCEVTVICGEKEEILEVKEPNKCEYSMKFTTPAACRESEYEELKRSLESDEL